VQNETLNPRLGVERRLTRVWKEHADLPAADPEGGLLDAIPSEDTACAPGFPTGQNLRVRRELMARRDTITTTPPSFASSISSSL